jgi:hypothetical protein
MKNTFYFSHDYNARSDKNIKRLLAKHGIEGYGIFWAIIEDLYNNANALPMDCDCIAYDLRVQSEVIHSIIYDYDLFTINGDSFSSESVKRRINERDEKSVKARESALTGWEKRKGNANAMRTHSNGNAIKENKGNKKKVIKERETPDEFYKKQLELSGNDANYQKYIDVLYGKTTGIKLDGVLGLEYQLTFEKFTELLEKCKAKKKSLIQYTLDLENKGYYKKVKSIYLTFNNWLSREEI